MFVKKFLSIVALLFAGSQFVSANTTLNACGTMTGTDTECNSVGGTVTATNGYCISGTTIRVLTAADTYGCTVALTDNAVNIVKLDDENSAVIADISGTDITSPDDIQAKVAVVDCQSGDCIQVTGILKDSNDFFTLNAASGATTTATMAEDGTEYLVFDGNGAVAYKYQDDAQKKNGSENGENICVDDDFVMWPNRKEGLCEGSSDCINYYDCEGGDCTLSRKNPEPRSGCTPSTDVTGICDTGVHLEGNAIYDCVKSSGCSPRPGAEVPIGYVVAYDNSYIACKADGQCEAAVLGSNCGAGAQSGTLFGTNADDAELCIIPSGDSPITAPVSAAAKFMVPYKADLLGIGALNTNGYFITMEIDASKNVNILKETVRYRYTDTDHTLHHTSLYQVFSRSEAIATKNNSDEICNASGKVFEYKLVQWNVAGETLNAKVDYYIEGDNSDLS